MKRKILIPMIAAGLLLPVGVFAAGEKTNINEVKEAVKAKVANETIRPGIPNVSKPKSPAQETQLGKQGQYAEQVATQYGFTDIVTQLKGIFQTRQALIEKATLPAENRLASFKQKRDTFESKYATQLAEIDKKVANKTMTKAQATNAKRVLVNEHMGFNKPTVPYEKTSKQAYAGLKTAVAERSKDKVLASLQQIVKLEQELNEELKKRVNK
jgi:hypothetical protein